MPGREGDPKPPSGTQSSDPAEAPKEERPGSWLVRATLASGAALTLIWAVFLVWAVWHAMSGW